MDLFSLLTHLFDGKSESAHDDEFLLFSFWARGENTAHVLLEGLRDVSM